MGTLSENHSLMNNSSTDNTSDSGPEPDDGHVDESEDQNLDDKKVYPIFQKNYRPKVNPLKSLQRAIQKSTPRKKKSLLGKKETPGLSQMVIDAGQKRIGPIMCADCGLLYTPGEIEDEEEHRKAHARLDNLHTVMLWKNPNMIANFSDGAYIVSVKKTDQNKKPLKKLRHFMEWIESELGIVPCVQDENNPEHLFLYMCPAKRKNFARILGYASMEVLQKGSTVGQPINATEDTPWTKDVPAHIGITRIWTDALFRRKKIASRIVDNMRFHSGIPGYVVSKENIGIYEPNVEGKLFLETFTESKGWSYTYNVS